MEWATAARYPGGRGYNELENTAASVKSNHGIYRLQALANLVKLFDCGVWQWKPGEVDKHTWGSYHFINFSGTSIGRAFDVYIGDPRGHSDPKYRYSHANQQDRIHCAAYIQHHLSEYLTEGIFSGGPAGQNLSVKNGKQVSGLATWGESTWHHHNDHIHIAV